MIYNTEINCSASIIISDSVNCYGCSTDIAVVAVSKCIISSLVQIAAIQPYRYRRTNIISGVCLINDCTYRSIWNIVRICIIAVIGSCYLNRNLQRNSSIRTIQCQCCGTCSICDQFCSADIGNRSIGYIHIQSLYNRTVCIAWPVIRYFNVFIASR